ncbi:S1/P1 Nuclease [Tenacibaculum sp. MAR_2009_124]|uniref:S1/P1 nuclease n=1 Tax=Tenacibaculum sp. MAR_2009_124 TaxID=1250059 RepID=UPI0008969996|nr:S1/P1 nuclease [Tenacibaculum sp. MAR_2009_124]SEB75450.1 S1/P1 Nuclease [Tenacibaculum sp. MAR_2009_124]
MEGRFLIVVLSFILTIESFSNNTWGPTGHRATGEIAEKHLTRRAKRKIQKLLKGESLAFVSTFADEIKSDRKYSKFYPWHYVNMSTNKTYGISAKNKRGDLVTGIEYCIEVLKSKKSSEEDKRFYLKMLVHFIGDLHQPMHIGKKEDKGGNTIQVQWHGKGTNLHRVWDEDLLNQWGMSYLELARNAEHLSKEELKKIKSGTVVDWVHDTHELTKRVYNSAESGENLRYRYSYVYMPIVREQLQKGGVRLAKLLNDIFG